jgi:hypothetical protein
VLAEGFAIVGDEGDFEFEVELACGAEGGVCVWVGAHLAFGAVEGCAADGDG